MTGRDRKFMRCSDPRSRTGILVLASVLATLAGCATAGKVIPETAVPPNSVSEVSDPQSGPMVIRLGGGEEGFVITEAPITDAESRSDFEDAVALMNEGAYAKAIDLLERVIAGSPKAAAPHINLAMALIRLDQPEKAEVHLQTALSLVPDHPVAGQEYGLLLRRAGRFAEARAIYEQTLASFPEYVPVRKNLGILCDLYLYDLACALEQYEMYSAAVPEDEQVKLWIADLNLRLGRQ